MLGKFMASNGVTRWMFLSDYQLASKFAAADDGSSSV